MRLSRLGIGSWAPVAGSSRSLAYGYFAWALTAAVVAISAGALAVLVAATLTLACAWLLLRFQGYLLSPLTTIGVMDRVSPASVMLWAFALRMATSLLFSHIMTASFGHPFFGFNDDWEYEQTGEQVALRGLSVVLERTAPGYPVFLGALHWICGPLGGYHFLVPRLVNAGVGAVLAALLLQVAQRFSVTRQRQRLLAFTCVVFPDYLYYSSLTLRDIIIAYLWMLALGALLSQRSMKVRLPVLLVTIAALSSLRFYYAVLLGGLVAASSVLSLRNRWPARAWVGAVLLSLAILGIWQGDQVVAQPDDPGDMRADIEWRLAEYRGHSFGESAVGSTGDFSGLQKLSGSIPGWLRPGVMSALHYLSPLPFWKIKGKEDDPFVWLRLGSGAMWFFLSLASAVCAYRLLRAGQLSREEIQILTVIAIPVIASGISYFNVRYRLPAVGPTILLAFLAFDWRIDRRRFHIAVGCLLGALLVWELWRALRGL